MQIFGLGLSRLLQQNQAQWKLLSLGHPSPSQNYFDCETEDHHTGSGSLDCLPPSKNQRLLTANLHTPCELSGNAPPAFFFLSIFFSYTDLQVLLYFLLLYLLNSC
jgi:hypothetical protein